MTIDLKCDMQEANNSGLKVIVANTIPEVEDAVSGNEGWNVYVCIPYTEFSSAEQEEIIRLVDSVSVA